MKLARIEDHRAAKNTRSVVQLGRRDGSAEAGYYRQVSEVGGAMAEIGSRLRQAEIEAEIASAQLSTRDRLDRAYRELERDSEIDPDEVENRFRERADEILEQEGQRMQAPAYRRAWRAQAEAIKADGTIRARTLGAKKRTDRVRANVLEVGAGLKTMAEDPASPREVLDQSSATYLQLIERQRKAGIFSEEQAAAFRIEAEETVRAGHSLRHMSTIDTLSEQGRWGEAEAYFKANFGEIAPDKREGLEDILQQRSLDAQIMQDADNIWNTSGRDFEQAMEQASRIEDPDRRKAMEARLKDLNAIHDTGEAERQHDAYTTGLGEMLAGKSYSQLSPSLLAEMGPEKALSLKKEEESSRERRVRMASMTAEQRRLMKEDQAESASMLNLIVASNPEAQELIANVPPNEWANHGRVGQMMAQEYQGMADNDRIKLQTSVIEGRSNAIAADNVQKIRKQLVARMKIDLPTQQNGKDEFKASDLIGDEDFAERRDEPYSKTERTVLSAMEREIRTFFDERGNVPIGPDEEKEILRRTFRNIELEKPVFYPFDAVGIAKEVSQRELSAAYNAAVQMHGPGVTQQQVEDMARALHKRRQERDNGR